MIRVGCSRSTVRYTLGPVGSTLTNGFGTRKRRTPRRVLLPESGSTEIAARIGECVEPSCAHAVIVHSTVAVTASGRITMYLLDQRFRSSNHIRPPCRAYRPRCERRAPD